MSRQAIRSVKLRKIRRRVFILKIFSLILAISIFLGILIYGLNTNLFKIQNISVSGGKQSINEEIKDYTRSILNDSYFGILPKQNIFLYPKWEIENRILNKYPRVKDIQFELDPFKDQILRISINERKEHGVWCREQDCYFIDETGYIFAPSPTYSEGVVFSYRGSVEGDPLGQQYIDGELFKKISAFIRAIEAHPSLSELQPVSLEYIDSKEYSVTLADGGYIIFSDKHGLENVYENIVLSVENGDIEINRLEYIDARISNKVFYKHKTVE